VIVLDASAAVELLLATPRGRRVADRLDGADAVAPQLLDVEVVSALARLVRGGEVDVRRADLAVVDLRAMPVRRLPHRHLLVRAWRLRDRFRIADGFYVACAELLGAPLLTTDARLARSSLSGLTVTLVR
jgi:predicted nucleic acid-binding protein